MKPKPEVIAKIEDAMEKLRRFLYDAKRELTDWRDAADAKTAAIDLANAIDELTAPETTDTFDYDAYLAAELKKQK